MKHLLLFAAGLMVGANLVYFLLHRDGRVAPETVPPAAFAQPANTQADPAPGTRPPPSSQPAVTTPATLRAATGVQSPPAGSLMLPVAGIQANELTDTFNQTRDGTRRHEALDIMAARGTPVVAASDGTVVKLFTSVPGGLTVYEFDPTQAYAYYYAHLDHYAAGLAEGQVLHRGDVIGYVGSTGNASEDAPHLHFAIFLLGAEKQWWKGTPINPYPLLARAQ
jgi:murein DD-endopeptidase MepM/ murein hydrolase activator NlpD